MEFDDIGKHCQYGTCNLKDFLPFKCDGCLKFYCLEHYTYDSHECSNPNHNSNLMIICPLCLEHIKIQGELNVHQVWENHAKNICKGNYNENKEKTKKKK